MFKTQIRRPYGTLAFRRCVPAFSGNAYRAFQAVHVGRFAQAPRLSARLIASSTTQSIEMSYRPTAFYADAHIFADADWQKWPPHPLCSLS